MRVVAALLLLTGASCLAGCSSTIDHIPTAVGGLPEGTPARPAAPGEFPAVHDMPPDRAVSRLTEEERKRLHDDLVASRERAAQANPDAVTAATAQSAGTAKKP
jgi:hypothetical protein